MKCFKRSGKCTCLGDRVRAVMQTKPQDYTLRLCRVCILCHLLVWSKVPTSVQTRTNFLQWSSPERDVLGCEVSREQVRFVFKSHQQTVQTTYCIEAGVSENVKAESKTEPITNEHHYGCNHTSLQRYPTESIPIQLRMLLPPHRARS